MAGSLAPAVLYDGRDRVATARTINDSPRQEG
jgi:hypothetical protein